MYICRVRVDYLEIQEQASYARTTVAQAARDGKCVAMAVHGESCEQAECVCVQAQSEHHKSEAHGIAEHQVVMRIEWTNFFFASHSCRSRRARLCLYFILGIHQSIWYFVVAARSVQNDFIVYSVVVGRTVTIEIALHPRVHFVSVWIVNERVRTNRKIRNWKISCSA